MIHASMLFREYYVISVLLIARPLWETLPIILENCPLLPALFLSLNRECNIDLKQQG